MSHAEARVERALWRYKISKKTWEASPEITPIIWRTMGNQLKAMEALRFSEDPEVKKLLTLYFDMTKDDQERLPLEIPCMAAKVSPQHILGQLILSARDLSRAESAMVAIVANPEILRSSAAFGTALPNNVKDREMMLKVTQTLQTPGGSSVNVNVFSKPDDDLDDVDPEDSDLPSDVFAYDVKTIDGWGDQRRRLMDEDKRK